jgi:hypothetical protein
VLPKNHEVLEKVFFFEKDEQQAKFNRSKRSLTKIKICQFENIKPF